MGVPLDGLNNPINWIDPSGLKKCGPCEEEYFDKGIFWSCFGMEMLGFGWTTGPGFTAMYWKSKATKKHFKKIAKRFFGRVGKKLGGKLIPYIGWGLTAIDIANATAKCKEEATKCRPKT